MGQCDVQNKVNEEERSQEGDKVWQQLRWSEKWGSKRTLRAVYKRNDTIPHPVAITSERRLLDPCMLPLTQRVALNPPAAAACQVMSERAEALPHVA
jgi:hypothetical protein